MRKGVLIGWALAGVWGAGPAFAADVAAAGVDVAKLCQGKDETVLKRVYVPKGYVPNYFHRVLSGKNWVMFANGSRDGAGNRQQMTVLLNLDTGKAMRGPGLYDLVPLLNEEVLTQPDPMRFYLTDKVLKGGDVPAFAQLEQSGEYQSTGVVTSKGSITTHRILTDATVGNNDPGLIMRDVDFRSPTRGAGDITKYGELKRVCRGKRLKLPMLSKDGRMVSAVDEADGMTKVFEIGEKNDHCKEILNLRVGAGKADFSYDGRYLTFHKAMNASNALPSGRFSEFPSASWHTNVYVYDMKDGRVSQITHNAQGNSTYPVFRKDGTIVYLDAKPGARAGTTVFSYVVADPKKAQDFEAVQLTQAGHCRECDEAKDRIINLTALGSLWSALCSKDAAVNQNSAVMAALSLDHDQCEEMVRTQWKNYRAKVAQNLKGSLKVPKDKADKIDEDKLLAVCPAKTASEQEIGTQAKANGDTAGDVLAKKCAVCHTGGAHPIDFTDLPKLFSAPSKLSPGKSMGEAMLDRLDPNAPPSQRMPLGGQLGGDDAKLVTDALTEAKTQNNPGASP